MKKVLGEEGRAPPQGVGPRGDSDMPSCLFWVAVFPQLSAQQPSWASRVILLSTTRGRHTPHRRRRREEQGLLENVMQSAFHCRQVPV